MLNRAKKLALQVRRALPLGSPNVADEKNAVNFPLYKKTIFARDLVDSIFRTSPKEFKSDETEKNLFKILLKALFTKVNQGGNCGEYNGLFFAECLKKGISNSIEMIIINGIKPNGNQDNHCVVLLDRDAKKQELTSPEKWEAPTLVCDTWNAMSKVDACLQQDSKRLEKITGNFLSKVTSIVSKIRFEANLTDKQWSRYLCFLKHVQSYLTVESQDLLLTSTFINSINKKYKTKFPLFLQIDIKPGEMLNAVIDEIKTEMLIVSKLIEKPAIPPNGAEENTNHRSLMSSSTLEDVSLARNPNGIHWKRLSIEIIPEKPVDTPCSSICAVM